MSTCRRGSPLHRVRCFATGQNASTISKNNCSATFVAFPYLDDSTPAKLNLMGNNELHPPRSLLNALYSWETIYNHSRQQIYTRFLKDSAKRIICVPCIWALQIDDSWSAYPRLNFQLTLRIEYLVTCGIVSQDKIFKMCSIQEECITPTIRFVDDEGRVILRHTNAYSTLLVWLVVFLLPEEMVLTNCRSSKTPFLTIWVSLISWSKMKTFQNGSTYSRRTSPISTTSA